MQRSVTNTVHTLTNTHRNQSQHPQFSSLLLTSFPLEIYRFRERRQARFLNSLRKPGVSVDRPR